MTLWLPTRTQGVSIECPVEHLSLRTRDRAPDSMVLHTEDRAPDFSVLGATIGVQPDHERAVTSIAMISDAGERLVKKN